VDDEYTPGQPNSYEDVVRLRTRRVATEAAARERERQRVELERQRHELEEERRAAAAAAGTAPDRSSLNVTGEEAHTRRATLTFVKPGSRLHAQGSRLHAQGAAVLAGEAEMKPEMKPEPQKPAAPVKDKGMSLAQKMMEKMGWKEGSGLGKDGQGMTTPLMAQKDGIRSGVIVNAPEMFPNRSTVIGDAPAEGEGAHTGEGARLGAPAFVSSSDSLVAVVPAAGEEERFAAPTRVLLLRNLTGPGEVDGDLEDEVAEECERFGAVVRVVIFEVTDAGYPAREAVRIFTEFVEDASAERCRAEMDGRFFGGRTVRATFYDEDKFFANDIGPQPGERAVGL
jgi:splicing factor 45